MSHSTGLATDMGTTRHRTDFNIDRYRNTFRLIWININEQEDDILLMVNCIDSELQIQNLKSLSPLSILSKYSAALARVRSFGMPESKRSIIASPFSRVAGEA